MRNLTMMTDLYQLTMMYGYYKFGMTKNQAVFDVFFRENMPNSGNGCFSLGKHDDLSFCSG